MAEARGWLGALTEDARLSKCDMILDSRLGINCETGCSQKMGDSLDVSRAPCFYDLRFSPKFEIVIFYDFCFSEAKTKMTNDVCCLEIFTLFPRILFSVWQLYQLL